MLKKTLLASAIAVAALGSVNANADIAVTLMEFGGAGGTPYGVTGSLLEGNGGSLQSTGFFFGHTFNATQATSFMDSTGSWSGTGFSYDAEIAAMTAGQTAVGMLFNWNTSTGIHVLEIFDCAGGICTGNGIPMADGPFAGSIALFSGTGVGNPVPVPAAVWLMGSGLLGLVGVARRRKHA